MKYNKDMTISQVLESNKNAKAVLTGFGFHCLGCPMSLMETLEEASYVHEVELDVLLEKLDEMDKEKTKENTKKIVERKCIKKTKVK